MRIVVAGSSGFVGTHLLPHLRDEGHEVLTLVRRTPRAGHEIEWDPSTGTLDVERLAGVDAAVNLAGAPLAGKRWDASYKRTLRSSRTDSTRTIAQALAEVGSRVLVQASAMGYYGQHHSNDIITETDSAGKDFTADLCVDWEAAARPAAEAGIRVAYLRTSLVMGPDGGAFEPVLRTIKLGIGGRMGSGKAWWSFITMPDMLGAISFLLTEDVDGPVNLAAPEPATNAQLTKQIAQEFHRPSLAVVPAPVLRLVIGEFADEILASRRLDPRVLLDAGYSFKHPDSRSAAQWLAGQN
ncbi:MAG: TIGR01777 family oxidoreductase [Actinomycetales bacterium]